MKIFKSIIVVVFILCAISCREDSDMIPSYAYDGNESPIHVDKEDYTYAGQFEAFWTAMSCNYPLWDYEAEYGIDWGEIKKKYLPKFEELDQIKAKTGGDVDNEIKALYDSVISPLHDGHLYVVIHNIHKPILLGEYQPQRKRIELRDDYHNPFTQLDFYRSEEAGENIIEEYEESGITYSQFRGNIQYLSLQGISTTALVIALDLTNNDLIAIDNRSIWTKWFNKIQDLHKQNELGGIIIDLRRCPGGDGLGSQYLIGSLIPSDVNVQGYNHIGSARYKVGVGQFDCSPLLPFYLKNLEQPHESIVKERIAILTNSMTASCAELVCLQAKELDNAKIIGGQTFGSFGPLSDDSYHFNNAGSVGKSEYAIYISNSNTPYIETFSIDIPTYAFFTKEGEILDGIGIAPDIPSNFDKEEYERTGRDTQLERALEYIRTGK